MNEQTSTPSYNVLWLKTSESKSGIDPLPSVDFQKLEPKLRVMVARGLADFDQQITHENYHVILTDPTLLPAVEDRMRAFSSPSEIVLLLDEDVNENLLMIESIINSHPKIPIVKVSELGNRGIRQIISSAEQLVGQRLVKERYRHNLGLEAMNNDLETLVAERTSGIERGKQASAISLQKSRDLIQFIKDVGTCANLGDLLMILRRDLRKTGISVDPTFLSFPPNAIPFLVSVQNRQSIKLLLPDSHTDLLGSLKNEGARRKYLANVFSRPFGKSFLLPIEITDHSLKGNQVFLVIEVLTMDLDEDFIFEFLNDRSKTMSMSIERIFLEDEHTKRALLWERTFDSINNSVAILDDEMNVLRSNSLFNRNDESLTKCYQIFAARTEPCEGCPLLKARQSKKSESSSLSFADGETFLAQSFPISLENGKVTNFINSYQNTTKSRETYIRLLQSEKMAALGSLAGNIAHELNNPLTGMRSLAQVMLSETQEPNELKKDLEEIERATDRCQRIISNLLEFSSSQDTKFEMVNIDETIERTLPMLKVAVRSHRMDVRLDSSGYRARGQSGLIQHVIFNLVNNACQAMVNKGKLIIQTGFDDVSEEVFFNVKDSGPGIPPEIQNKIFNPFFTTKKEGQGTGLGLSLSRDIIRRMGGEITFQTEVGIGTEFIVRLPGVKSESAHS